MFLGLQQSNFAAEEEEVQPKPLFRDVQRRETPQHRRRLERLDRQKNRREEMLQKKRLILEATVEVK